MRSAAFTATAVTSHDVPEWLGRDGLELLNAEQDRYWFPACYDELGPG